MGIMQHFRVYSNHDKLTASKPHPARATATAFQQQEYRLAGQSLQSMARRNGTGDVYA